MSLENEKSDIDDLVHLIGQAVVNDEKIRDAKWAAIALSTIVGDSSTDMNGFTYAEDGKSTPNTPSDLNIHEMLKKLRQGMVEHNGDVPWKSCLLQITREDMSIKMDFEYENEDRWKVTPKNRKEIISLMKP